MNFSVLMIQFYGMIKNDFNYFSSYSNKILILYKFRRKIHIFSQCKCNIFFNYLNAEQFRFGVNLDTFFSTQPAAKCFWSIQYLKYKMHKIILLIKRFKSTFCTICNINILKLVMID